MNFGTESDKSQIVLGTSPQTSSDSLAKPLSQSQSLQSLRSPPEITVHAEEPYSIFDQRQKALIVFLVSTAATFSGFASNIYFPALPTIAHDLNVSVELVNLTITSYLIFQGLAPSLWGPISDVRGRRVAYFCTFIVFFGACIGLAQTKNYATLIVLRCLQSTGSASTIAIGSGVIGDITTRAERGGFMGIFQAGLLAPVAVGPVIGGAMAGSLGWRSIFWFLTIYSGIFLLVLVFLLPETLRSIVANGLYLPPGLLARYPLNLYQKTTSVQYDGGAGSRQQLVAKKHIDVTAPFRILVSKRAAPIIVFLAILYAVWQMSITAMSSLFSSRYGLTESQIGLTFIANGAGSIVGTLVTGKVLDLEYRRTTSPKQGEVEAAGTVTANTSRTDVGAGDSTASPSFKADISAESEDGANLERARLRLIPFFVLLQCLSILVFGWTVNFSSHVPLAIPIMATFVTGWTAVSTQSIVTTYLVDVFADQSASACASLNLARCLVAAGGVSAVGPLMESIGVGWAFTLGVGTMATGTGGWWVQRTFGGRWRRQEQEKK